MTSGEGARDGVLGVQDGDGATDVDEIRCKDSHTSKMTCVARTDPPYPNIQYSYAQSLSKFKVAHQDLLT